MPRKNIACAGAAPTHTAPIPTRQPSITHTAPICTRQPSITFGPSTPGGARLLVLALQEVLVYWS